MMLLVDVLVDARVVEEPVNIVEADLSGKKTENEIASNGLERRQDRIHGVHSMFKIGAPQEKYQK